MLWSMQHLLWQDNALLPLQSFGLLMTKGQQLKQPLHAPLNTVADFLECTCCLHNVCINMRSSNLTNNLRIEEIIWVEASPLWLGCNPTVEALVPHRSVQGPLPGQGTKVVVWASMTAQITITMPLCGVWWKCHHPRLHHQSYYQCNCLLQFNNPVLLPITM